MKATPFSHDIRVLTCQVCGAPVDAALTGGQIKCAYCGATHHIVERNEQTDRERARLGLGAAISESERHAQLRLQQGGEQELPPSLRAWLREDGALDPLYAQAATSDWQQQRQQLAAGSKAFTVAERLFHLTLLLAEQLEPLRARAMLETTAEVLVDERHRHVVRCMLARLAAQNGDVTGASAWLETCNPRPTDLMMDTAYRHAAATLAVAQRNPERVAELLGIRSGDVPLAPREALACELLRVHTFELAGNLQVAFEELDRLARARGEVSVARQLAAFQPLALCPYSYPERQRRLAEQRDRALLAAAVEKRAKVRTGFMAVIDVMSRLPYIAFVLLIVLAPIRCVSDSDPLFGAYGIALCPHVCNGCYGPTRTVTHWVSSGGEHTTNGAEYYCNSPRERVAALSDERLEELRYGLGQQELGFVAVAGGSYLILLGILVTSLPITGLRRHRRSAALARELDQELRDVAQRLGEPPPLVIVEGGPGAVLRSLRVFAISIVVACLLIAISLNA